jgi:hypothetical protein
MERGLKQMMANPAIYLLWNLKWSLLGTPVIGYAIGGIRGAVFGGASMAGLWLGGGGLVLGLKAGLAAYARRQEALGALCPRCLKQLQGRHVCVACGEELPPVAYLPGLKLTAKCHKCQANLNKEGAMEIRCMEPECQGKSILPFPGHRGRFALVISKSPADLAWTQGWTQHEEWGHGGRVGVADRTAVLVRTFQDRDFSVEHLDPDAEKALTDVWVEADVNPGVYTNIRTLLDARIGARVTMERTPPRAQGMDAALANVALGDWLAELLKA